MAAKSTGSVLSAITAMAFAIPSLTWVYFDYRSSNRWKNVKESVNNKKQIFRRTKSNDGVPIETFVVQDVANLASAVDRIAQNTSAAATKSEEGMQAPVKKQSKSTIAAKVKKWHEQV